MSAAAAQGLGGISYPVEPPSLTPGVRASATYSDNIDLRPSGREKGDLLFEVSPYITAESNAPRANYRLSYQMRNFFRVREGEFNLLRHSLNGRGSFALVGDRLWVDAAAFMGNVAQSVNGPISADPGASFDNSARVSRFSVSPWYRDRLGNFADYTLRYSLAHNGGNSSYALARIEQGASATVDSIDTGSPWNWRYEGNYQLRDYGKDFTGNDFSRGRRTSTGTLFYRLNPNIRVFGMVVYEQIDGLRNSDGDDFGYGPGLGFDWRPSIRTSVSASLSRRYYGTVGEARASYSRGNATMGVNFSRSVITNARDSLLFFDPMALTTGDLGVGAANPVLSDLSSRGILLPPGLALSQSLVTDSPMLDRRATAFFGLHGARNSLTFSGFLSNRTSSVTVDPTTVAGIRASTTQGGVFFGELHERGVIASYQRRLDVRSAIDVSLDRRTVTSPTAGFATRFITLRAGYSTQLTSDTTAFTGIRRTQQRGNNGSSSYDENAIYAGVDVRFR